MALAQIKHIGSGRKEIAQNSTLIVDTLSSNCFTHVEYSLVLQDGTKTQSLKIAILKTDANNISHSTFVKLGQRLDTVIRPTVTNGRLDLEVQNNEALPIQVSFTRKHTI